MRKMWCGTMTAVLMMSVGAWAADVYTCGFEPTDPSGSYTTGALTGQGSPAWEQNFLNSYDTGGEVVSGVSYDGTQSLHLHGSYATCQQTSRVTLPSVTRAPWFEFAFKPNFDGENNEYITWARTTRGKFTDTVGIDMKLTNNATRDISIGGTVIGSFTNGVWQTISFKHEVSGSYYTGQFDVYLNGTYVTSLFSPNGNAYNGLKTMVFSSAESSWTKNGDWYVDGIHLGDTSVYAVEAPTFSPDVTEVSGTVDITISSSQTGAVIYYTTNGSTPTPTTGTLYSRPVSVSGGMTLKAIAVLNGVSSSVASKTYLIYTVVDGRTDRLNTTPNAQSSDYVLQNGSVHVNGNVYKHFVLSGTVTNWTGYTNSTTWAGTWGYISLMGSDYFIGRIVPTDVDETMASLFQYLGDDAYGEINKQCGFAANAGIVVYRVPDKTGSAGFAAEDCAPNTPSGHKSDMTVGLTNQTQFEFRIVYDLEAMTMTVSIKDVGDTDWDASAKISIGLRNDPGLQYDNVYDDWSDLVLSIQMSDNLSASEKTETYGFNYDIDLSVGNMLAGDANFDGQVDVGDLGILAANYGGAGKKWNQGDFNNDGLVDVGDLGILAANYGKGVSSADFEADYAKVFGSTAVEETSDESSLCSSLGLSLMAGLAILGLTLIKLEE